MKRPHFGQQFKDNPPVMGLGSMANLTGSGGMSGMGNAFPIGIDKAEDRRPEIPTAIEDLQCATERLAQSIAALEARLSPVTRPREPEGGNETLPVCSTHFGGALKNLNALVRALVDSIDSIETRLEL